MSKRLFGIVSSAFSSTARDQFELVCQSDHFDCRSVVLRKQRHRSIPLWRQILAEILDFNPDFIHAVGPAAVLGVGFLTNIALWPQRYRRWTASGVGGKVKVDPFTRWCLRSASRVIAYEPSEEEWMRTFAPERFERLSPGVIVPPITHVERTAVCRRHQLPESARLIVCVAGNWVEARHAIWAFDVMKYLSADLHLVLLSDTPDTNHWSAFARSLGKGDDRVRFVAHSLPERMSRTPREISKWGCDLRPAGTSASVEPLIGLAEQVWAARQVGGSTAVLNAMMAGKPIVALATPDYEAILEHGQSGVLCPPNEPVEWARRAGELLADTERSCRMANAAHTRACGKFGFAAMVKRLATLYDKIKNLP